MIKHDNHTNYDNTHTHSHNPTTTTTNNNNDNNDDNVVITTQRAFHISTNIAVIHNNVLMIIAPQAEWLRGSLGRKSPRRGVLYTLYYSISYCYIYV